MQRSAWFIVRFLFKICATLLTKNKKKKKTNKPECSKYENKHVPKEVKLFYCWKGKRKRQVIKFNPILTSLTLRVYFFG